MARSQLEKANYASNGPQKQFPSNLLLKAALFKVDNTGRILNDSVQDQQLGLFLLNPTTWEETKTANWIQNQVPGQSDPILQWLSSGPRQITFDALVTMDTSEFIKQRNIQANQGSSNFIQNVSANIAAKFFNTALPAPRVNNTNQTSAQLLSIAPKLNYYRSLVYPLYDDITNPTKVMSSPPLIVLYSGGTFSTSGYGDKIRASDDLFVVTNLTIRITKQLPNLEPMEATVSFQIGRAHV